MNLRGARTIQCQYDCVLGTAASQVNVYAALNNPVQSVLKGINCTVLAYGQTGTGKTYTMLGDGVEADLSKEDQNKLTEFANDGSSSSGDGDDNKQVNFPSTWGVIPRALSDLFQGIRDLPSDTLATVTCSYLQIYNNSVFDLLQDPNRQRPLALRERASGIQDVLGDKTNVFVQGLSEFRVTSLNEVLDLLHRGGINRAIRATRHNEASSRSHAILQIHLELETTTTTTNGGDDGTETEARVSVIRRAKLNLVDLAGSEKYVKKKPKAGVCTNKPSSKSFVVLMRVWSLSVAVRKCL